MTLPDRRKKHTPPNTTQGFESLGMQLDKLYRKQQEKLTPGQQRMADKFYEVVRRWSAGAMTLDEVMEEAWNSYVRFRIVMATPKSHELWDDIQRLLDALITHTRGPGVWLGYHWFSEREIQQYGGKIEQEYDRETGEIEEFAVFPTGYAKDMEGNKDFNRPIYGNAPRIRSRFNPDTISRPQPKGKKLWDDAVE
jgi:hypothetical protein